MICPNTNKLMYEMLSEVRITLFAMPLSIAQRTLRFLCSKRNNNNITVLVSAWWKYASNNAISPLGYTLHILEIITVLKLCLIYLYVFRKLFAVHI